MRFRYLLWFLAPAIGLIVISYATNRSADVRPIEALHETAKAEFNLFCAGKVMGRSEVVVSGGQLTLPTLVKNQSELAQVIYSGAQITLEKLWTRVSKADHESAFLAEWEAPDIRVKSIQPAGPMQPEAYHVQFDATIRGYICSPEALQNWSIQVSQGELAESSHPLSPTSEPLSLTLSADNTHYGLE